MVTVTPAEIRANGVKPDVLPQLIATGEPLPFRDVQLASEWADFLNYRPGFHISDTVGHTSVGIATVPAEPVSTGLRTTVGTGVTTKQQPDGWFRADTNGRTIGRATVPVAGLYLLVGNAWVDDSGGAELTIRVNDVDLACGQTKRINSPGLGGPTPTYAGLSAVDLIHLEVGDRIELWWHSVSPTVSTGAGGEVRWSLSATWMGEDPTTYTAQTGAAVSVPPTSQANLDEVDWDDIVNAITQQARPLCAKYQSEPNRFDQTVGTGNTVSVTGVAAAEVFDTGTTITSNAFDSEGANDLWLVSTSAIWENPGEVFTGGGTSDNCVAMTAANLNGGHDWAQGDRCYFTDADATYVRPIRVQQVQVHSLGASDSIGGVMRQLLGSSGSDTVGTADTIWAIRIGTSSGVSIDATASSAEVNVGLYASADFDNLSNRVGAGHRRQCMSRNSENNRATGGLGILWGFTTDLLYGDTSNTTNFDNDTQLTIDTSSSLSTYEASMDGLYLFTSQVGPEDGALSDTETLQGSIGWGVLVGGELVGLGSGGEYEDQLNSAVYGGYQGATATTVTMDDGDLATFASLKFANAPGFEATTTSVFLNHWLPTQGG